MNTSIVENRLIKVCELTATADSLSVELSDGRTIIVPVAWYPRLQHGTTKERQHWRLIGGGTGIHWPDLDEDVSVENLLLGQPSGESQASFQKWLRSRSHRAPKTTKA